VYFYQFLPDCLCICAALGIMTGKEEQKTRLINAIENLMSQVFCSSFPVMMPSAAQIHKQSGKK